jgi:hypothetical protein
MLINIIVFRNHYFRIDKQQFREASDLVKERNLGYPVYSVFPLHFNYYFRDNPIKTNELDIKALHEVDRFWLLQAEFFTPKEKEDVLESLGGQFQVLERYPFHKTEALLLTRSKE